VRRAALTLDGDRLAWLFGGVGLAMLCASACSGATLVAPCAMRNLRLEKRGAAPAGAMRQRPVATRRCGRGSSMSFWLAARADAVNNHITSLHEVAARHRLALKTGEYRPASGARGKMGELRIAVNTEGNYRALRNFLAEVQGAMPFVALNRCSFSRRKIGDAALQADLEFTLFYAQGPS